MTTSVSGPGSTDASLDPHAGGTYRDKPIWDLDQITANLNRTGYDWYTNNYGELDDGVLNFGFWRNIEELSNSYYVNETGSIAFNEAYYSDDFSAFNDGQIAAAEKTIGLWNDLIAIDFKETKSGDADITYGNTYTGGAQAYAYLPFGSTIDAFYKANYDFDQAGRLGGDVWIDGFVASNFFPLQDSYYSITTLIHETGHALGLSHPGDYNALDDNDGDGVPDPITYENDASFAQDSLQYSIMSYFDGYETGAQFIDFNLLNFAYPSTPLIHDIATIQAIYGADYTTRTGDTTYGFHSTEVGTAYDFDANNRPIISIWDGAGNDTLDFSGFTTKSLINLNEGTFSSGGGADHFATLDEINANRAALGFAPRSQATYDYYQDLIARLGVTNPQFKDNISIAYGVTIENAIGGSNNDKIIANNVANILNGRGGDDTVSYESALSGVDIALRSQAVGAGGAAGDKLISIESAIGSRFDDTIVGNRFDNTIDGGRGDDTLKGGRGSDTFVFRTDGTSGHDKILGFGTDDLIAVQRRITDSDGDGVIRVGQGGVLVVDPSDGDSIVIRGAGASNGLHLVGQAHGYYYYASVDSTVSQATINRLSGPTDTIEETDAKTAAQIAAANGPETVNLGERADGYTGASGTHFGEGSGAFSQGVSVDENGSLIAAQRGESSANPFAGDHTLLQTPTFNTHIDLTHLVALV